MVDPTSLAAALATAAGPSAKALLTKVGKRKYDQFIATYTNVFSDHVRATFDRCSWIKTILHRDQPIRLDSQYVQLLFDAGADTVAGFELVKRAAEHGNGFLVSGLAGSGKSMFMKWAALRFIEMIPNTQRIPLFVEIREVPAAKLELPFDQIVFEMSSAETSSASFEQFFIGLTEGIFIVMVDGLDEVPVKHRSSILNEITDFKRRFPKASLIASSRPDHQLESSNSLKVFRVKNMTVEQITAVVENALFDDQKKQAFIEALQDDLYEQHKSFLSNPLLATIMLITYDVGSGVPSKLSLFYSQVFETLFFKHDSSKGVYVREHYSKLDIDQFEAAFRTFCFQTYAMSKVTFLAPDLMELVRASLAQARINADPADFLKDCQKSLCLLQEDGIYTSFVHRSFQEYFSARFLSAYGGREYVSLVDEVVTRGFSDNTFKMLWQIDSDDVLRRWCLPKIRKLLEDLERLDLTNAKAVTQYVRGFAYGVYFSRETGAGMVFSWGHKDSIRVLQAINEVLAACGVSARVRTTGGNIYSNEDPSGAPRDLTKLMMPDLDDADDDEDESDDEDRLPLTAVRYTIRLSEIGPKIVLSTGFPAFFERVRHSLIEVQSEIERRLDSTDNFARKVTELFSSNSDD